MNKLNRRLHAISTLSQLHAERERIDYKLGLKEQDLQRSIEELKHALTFSNICRTVWNRMELPAMVSGMAEGFGLFSSVFRRKRKNHTCSF